MLYIDQYRFGVSITLPQAIDALNPVGWWRLDESSGSTAFDSSGNSRHGTYNGPTLGGQAGPDTNYATFDGSNDRVLIADNSAWTPAGAGMVIFALVRPTNSGYRDVVAKAGPSNNEYECVASSDTFRHTFWNKNGSEYGNDVCATFPTVNQWNVVVWKWPDVVLGSTIIHRLNKSNISTTHTTGGVADRGDGTEPLYIGGRHGHTDRYFQGALAHVAVFDTALTTAQIQTMEDAADNDGWI